jgi:hypothetical protein
MSEAPAPFRVNLESHFYREALDIRRESAELRAELARLKVEMATMEADMTRLLAEQEDLRKALEGEDE